MEKAFGNYIDVCCGVKDGFAEKYLSAEETVQRLNRDLFQFVGEKGIDVIICVSSLVFWKISNSEAVNSISGKINMIHYTPDWKRINEVLLKKDVRIYGISHPSSYGFKPYIFNDVLKEYLS